MTGNTVAVGTQPIGVMIREKQFNRYLVAGEFNVLARFWPKSELQYNVNANGTTMPEPSWKGVNWMARTTTVRVSKKPKEYMSNTPPSPSGMYGNFISASRMAGCIISK